MKCYHLFINVGYDAATVPDGMVLEEALYKVLEKFISEGALTPLKTEVIDVMNFGVEAFDAL
jgi:hypothetical protein